MKRKHPPVSAKLPVLMHGADYNPDQWLHDPSIFEGRSSADEAGRMQCHGRRYLRLGGARAVRRPISSSNGWTTCWIRSRANGIFAWLATPTGARPAWMSEKYPEVLRVEPNRVRNLHGMRHNHCYTSPVYREKTAIINGMLAERYGKHPAVIGWHISNEYRGECHCDLCQESFRRLAARQIRYA